MRSRTYSGGTEAVGGLLVAERVVLADDVELVPPFGEVRQLLCELGGEQLDQFGQHVLEVADDRHVCEADLRDFCRVNVDVDDLSLGCEGVELTGDAVVEACTEGNQQVRLLHCGDGGDGAVHAGHAEVLGGQSRGMHR